MKTIKKIMMMAAIVFAAITANASANLKWSASDIRFDGLFVNGVIPNVYLNDGDLVSVYYTAAGAGNEAVLADMAARKVGVATAGMSRDSFLKRSSVAATTVEVAGLDTTKMYDFYVVAFNAATINAATYYQMVAVTGVSYNNGVYNVAATFGSTWTAMPEATTGSDTGSTTTEDPAVTPETPAEDPAVEEETQSAMPITVGQATGGTVTASKASAAKGETVALTITSDSGYAYGTDDVKVYKTGDEATTVEVKDNAFVMPAFPVTVSVAFKKGVAYRYAVYNTDGDAKSGIKEWRTGVQESPTEVASYTGTRTWNSGWYVVTGTKTISGRITCKGNVHLILTDGATLNASAGITVNTVNSATLTIYGQSEGTGMLVATTTTTGNAGIGGYKNSSASYRNSGAITIHGGNVTASGGDQASGIGGGSYNGTGGTGKDITINGGTVVAKGGGGSAGIGGGYGGDSSNCGIGENIVINGGNVTSSCDGNNGSGIGGGKFGYGKNIWFNGGTVTVTGGAVTDSGATSGVGNGYGNATQSSEIYAGSRVTVSVSGDGNNWTEVAHETGVDMAGNIKYRYFKTTPLTPKVIATDSCEHGTVLANASEALPGETVTLTATPETGYVLYDIRAYKTGQEAIEVPLTPVVEDKTYSFTMPGYAVTVAATFVTAFTELIPSAPTSVDNATYKVYTKGVESADGKVWSNRKAVVVYTAADGCYFEDGATVSTNELDTTANPAVNKTTPATPQSAMPITVNPGIENGTVTASKAAAAKGEKITLTIASESGYAYGTDDVKVYRTGDEATTVEVKDDAFVMPTFPVTVSVAFKKGFAYRHAVYNTAGDAKGGIKEWKTATADATPIDAQTTWGSSGKETWYVVNADKTISSRIKCIGNVHLILANGFTLNASKGITVSENDAATLTIYGQAGNTGALVATGASKYAGIGGACSSTETIRCLGAVTIHGGTVTATGGESAAGIGGGFSSAMTGGYGRNITINGGVVTATGGAGGAGIGGAYFASGGNIVINGGTITASSSGSNSGSGIGAGYSIGMVSGSDIYVAENLLVYTRASEKATWATVAHAATTDLTTELKKTHVMIYRAYEVRVAACENGTVTASPVWAGENNLVTLTASPGDNCLLKSIAAYKLDDPEIPVELTPDANDLKYTFTMPAYDVAVEATFVPPQSLASVDLACLDVAVTLNDFPGDVAWTASSSNPNVATITSAGEAGTKPVVTSVALGEATMIIVTADRVYCCKTTVSHDFKPSESGMSFAVFTYDGVTLPIFYRGAAASLEASTDPKAASGELVLVFTDPNAAAVFEIPEPYLARAQVQTVGGGDVEGMTYETNVRLDKGRYAVNVGSGADAKVVVRIMKVFENVQIPYPDIAEEERRAKDGSLGLYTDGYGATPIIKTDPASPEMALTAYNPNAVRRASNGQDYTYAEVVSHTDGTVTTTDGVGTYQFVLNLKEGYSWQDGSALGSMDGRIVTWRIAEDPDCVAAELAINKSVRWSDDDPNAVITISSHASPAQSASVPNVLFIGTMCNGHSLDADRIIRSINSVAKNANVDWFLFNKPANDGSSGVNYYQNDLSGHVERNHTVGYMVKYGESLSITWDYQGNVIQSNPTLSSGTYSWSALKMNTNNHQALVPFLKKLDELLVEGNKYDYIVLEFDGSRLCDDYCALKYDGTAITDTKGKVAYARYANERRVAERLLPYYQSGKVLWVTDNSHNDSVEVWPYKSPNKYRPNTYFNNSQNRCLTLQQYEGLVALLDPERYLQYKDGVVDTIYQESKTAYQKTHYANRAWELQMNYEDAENLYTFLEDAVKVQPYNLSLVDTVRRHSGLSLTSVNCYVATNDLPVAATEGWVKMAEWVPSMGTTFDVSTWEAQAIKGFGWVDETKSAIDADENTVRFLATNITDDVWLKVEIGIVDDGAFRSNVEAVFNPVTGQYEKNPNDGKARMAMLDQDGTETVTGEAATAVPWKYSCHDIRVRAAFGEIAVNGLTNGLALAADNSITGTISICERSNPVVSFRALEDYRMTSLLIDGEERFDGVTAPTSWTFEQLLCDHEVSVAYEVITNDISLVQPVNGTVAIEGSGVIRKPVTITVTPDAGYKLDTITVTKTDDPSTKVTVTDNTFTMPGYAVTVSATFVADTTPEDPVVTPEPDTPEDPVVTPEPETPVYDISLVPPQNGTVAIAGTGAAHSLVTLTPTPDEGYALGSLTVTTAGGETLKLYEGNTFYMPEESVTVTATFADTRFENKVRLEPNSTYLYTLTVPEDVWNAANKEFLQTLARVYTGEGCALALSSELSGKGTLTTTPADGFSATSAMVASNGVMKTTITLKTGAVASYAAFSAVSQGAEYGEADSAKRTAAQAALKSATLAKATVTQETSASGGGDLLSGFSTSFVNGKYHAQNGYTLVDGNPRDYGWKIFYNDNNTDATFPGTYDLEPNSEYTLTLAVPKDAWDLSKSQYLQVEVRVYTAVPDGKSLPPIMLGSRSASEKAATDPKVKGDVKEYYVKEDGTDGYKYPNGNGYNTGTGVGGYEAEAWMTVREDGMVETKVVMKIGADGGHLAINLFAYGSGWMNDRLAVGEKAAKEMTLVKTPTETVTEVATEVESSFACGEGGKTVTTTYLTDFNVGTGRWSDTAAALADDGNSYSTDGLKALDSEIEYAQPHTITVAETENGTVTADGTGAIDARITLTVTPAENYKLETLTVTTANGAAITLDDGNAFIMPDDDVTIAATFLVKAFAITCAAVADGAISVPETADAGSTVTLKFNTLDFTLTENTLKVTADGENVALTPVDAGTYTFTMPDGAVQVDATYTAIVTQPVLQTESGEEQLTISAEWREKYKLRNSQVTNVTQKLDNGMTAWQSYVLGRDPTNVLSGIYADVEQDDKTDTVTIEAVGLDKNTIVSGFGLTYRLEKTEEPGFLKENAVSPEFDVGIADETQDPTGHYKLSMVVTKDNVPVEGAVEAINTVGIVRQTQAATNAIISVPWSRLAPGQDQEIQVSEVVKTANLDEGDELRVYRPGSSTYESYTLDANKQWVAAKTFKVAAVGSGSQSDAPEAPAATITRGSGIWLCRKDPSKPYFLYGQSNGADESKVTVVQGPNLIGATGTGDYNFNEHILNAQEGDVIMVPGTGAVPLRYEFKDGVWGRWGSIPGKTVIFKGKTVTTSKTVWKTDDAFVAPGTGFWLHNNSGKITVK